jgi:hypothetical protein
VQGELGVLQSNTVAQLKASASATEIAFGSRISKVDLIALMLVPSLPPLPTHQLLAVPEIQKMPDGKDITLTWMQVPVLAAGEDDAKMKAATVILGEFAVAAVAEQSPSDLRVALLVGLPTHVKSRKCTITHIKSAWLCPHSGNRFPSVRHRCGPHTASRSIWPTMLAMSPWDGRDTAPTWTSPIRTRH